MASGAADRAPRLSVVVVVRHDSAAFRLMVERLRRQTVAPLLELVVVAPSAGGPWTGILPPAGLHDIRLVAAGSSMNEADGKTTGVHAASAPLVAFVEDHSFPDPRWAQAMLDAHEDAGAAVVGPVMTNANPVNGVSWGCFLAFYSQWLSPSASGQAHHLPANQSCYRRSVLLEYGDRLAEMLGAESVLHWDLGRNGHRLLLDPRAVTAHLNFSRLAPCLREYFLASRVFAARRAAAWNAARRWCYAVGSPLLPLLRTVRIVGHVRGARLALPVLVRALPSLLAILAAGALGELAGYARGEGTAGDRLARFHDGRHGMFLRRDLDAAAS